MRQHHLLHRAGALLLAGALALGMVGCGGAGSGGQPITSKAKGRWVEQKITMEEDASLNFCSTPLLMEDGSLCIYATSTATEEGSISRYVSADNGASWTKQPLDWAAQIGGIQCRMTPYLDGTCFIQSYTDTVRYWLQQPGDEPLEEVILPEELASVSQICFFDGDTVLISGFTYESSGDTEITLTDDSGKPISHTSGIYDIHLQEKQADFAGTDPIETVVSGAARDGSDPAAPGIYRIVYTENGAKLELIDAQGESQTVFEKLPAAGDASFGATSDSAGNYYYASHDGIHRIAKGGSLTELVLEAGTFQLGMESNFCSGLCRTENGDYLALLSNSSNQTTLYRYTWDETLPAENEELLTIWSLEESPTVRAAIVELSRQNPELGVEHQIALAEDGISKNDAITALNAQLLAGSGPDILILDGLDYPSYQKKGLLADFAGSVPLDELLPNVTAPFVGEDGSVTVLPARFGVPLLFSDHPEIAQVNSLDTLKNAILAAPVRPAMDGSDDAYYAARSAEERYGISLLGTQNLLDFALASSAAALWDGQQLDTDAVKQLLSFVSEIGQYYELKNYKPDLLKNGVTAGGDGSDDVTFWDGTYEYSMTGGARYGWGMMQTPAFLGSTNRPGEKSDATVIAQPGLCEGAYLPTTLVAINGSSQKQAEAKTFLGVLFGQAVQDVYQQDGCPVRTTSLQESIEHNQKSITRSGYTGDVMALFSALKTPVCPLEPAIYDALLKAADALVRGTEDLDTAVTGVTDDLSLYLSEKQ